MESEIELNKAAWTVFKEALRSVKLPDYITVSEREDGSFSLVLMMTDKDIGSITINFTPSIEKIKNFLFDKSSEPFTKTFDYTLAYFFAELFLKNFNAEMKETFAGLDKIPLLIIKLSISKALSEAPNNSKKEIQTRLEETKSMLEDFCEEQKRKTKRRILDEIETRDESYKPVKHLIAYYYELVLPKWEQAKSCYKKNKNFNNWEKMVAVSFEDLPEDLIKRLGDLDTYQAMPSSIALEHAGRLCGIKKNSLGLRALQNYLQQSRDRATRVGKETIENEVKEHFEETLNEVTASFAMSKIFRDESSFDTDSLLHQIIAEQYGEQIKKLNPQISGNKMKRVSIRCEHFNSESDNNS